MNKPQVICYIAAKSGGHILPALTLIKRHKTSHPDDRIVLFTSDSDLDNKIRQESSLITEHFPISLENVPRKKLEYPRFLYHVAKTFITCVKYFRTNKPAKVITLGGYISIPIVLAAYWLRIPIEIYELNLVPGRANMFLARYATTIFICFGASSTHFKRSCTFITYPLRFPAELRNYPQNAALAALDFSLAKKTILILGGSQGSIFINNLVKEWLINNPHLYSEIQIIHQTGNQDSFNWSKFYATHGIDAKVFDYTSSIENYYLAADLIIARAGAGSLFEIQFFNKRAIIIPLQTSSTHHQIDNARAMALQYPFQFTVLDQNECEHNPTIAFKELSNALIQIRNNQPLFFTQKVI